MRLFHYTDIHAVSSMLQSGLMWASDIRYLNDHSEYRDGEGCIQETFKSRLGELDGAGSEKMIAHLESFLESSKNSYTFICSLSEGEDLLSQWRGYCPRSGGYAIEFNLKDARDFGAPLHTCIYARTDKESMASSLFDLAKRIIIDRRGSKSKLFQTTWSNISRFKNSGFSEELERRIIIFKKTTDPEIKYRPREGLLVPYMEFELPFQLIKTIWIGPCPNPELATLSLKGYLESLSRTPGHYFQTNPLPEIRNSSITFRG